MSMPQQNPSTSKQDVETPADFIAAVESRFGELHVDLACSRSVQTDMFSQDNRKAPVGLCYPQVDALKVDWSSYGDMRCWLNPPFRYCDKFAEKCAHEIKSFGPNGRIYMLTPASVGSNWFGDFVFKKSFVLSLQPRLVFVGEEDQFPKDLMLTIFMRDAEQMIRDTRDWFDMWRWKLNEPRVRRVRTPLDIDSL